MGSSLCRAVRQTHGMCDSGGKKRHQGGRPGCEQQRPPCVYFKHLVMNANVPVLNNITYKLYVVSTKIKDKLLQKLCI